MASRYTMIGLAAIGVALAVILIADRSRDDSTGVDRRLVPEASSEAITAIEIRRPDEPPIAIARRPDGDMVLTAPIAVPLAAAAAADLVGTLEQLAFRRHVVGRPIAAARARVAITTASGATIELAIGDDIAATGQAWIARAGRPGSFAIDGHSARVLARGVDELRSRDVVLGDPAAATRIELRPQHGEPVAVLAGGSVVAIGHEGAVAMDRVAAAELFAGLAAMQFARFTAPAEAAVELEIRITRDAGEQVVAVHGSCPGDPTRRLVSATGGTGCVDRASIDAVAACAEHGRALWDARFAGDPVAVARVTLAVGDARVDGDGNDPGVRAWLREVDAAAVDPSASWIERPRGDPIGSLELVGDGGASRRVELHAVGGGGLALARPGESVARSLPAAAAGLLVPSPWRFRGRALIARDPTEVRRITVRDRGKPLAADIERGELVGEWRSVDGRAGSIDVAAAAAMARTLAQLEADRFASRDRARPVERTIEVEFDPAPGDGATARHVVELQRGCWAVLDRDPAAAFQLASEPCGALRAPVNRTTGSAPARPAPARPESPGSASP